MKMTCILKKCQGHEWKRKAEDCSCLKKMTDTTTKYLTWPWTRSWTRKIYKVQLGWLTKLEHRLWVWSKHFIDIKLPILWLCKWIAFFLGNIHWNIKGWRGMIHATFFQMFQKNLHIYTSAGATCNAQSTQNVTLMDLGIEHIRVLWTILATFC